MYGCVWVCVGSWEHKTQTYFDNPFNFDVNVNDEKCQCQCSCCQKLNGLNFKRNVCMRHSHSTGKKCTHTRYRIKTEMQTNMLILFFFNVQMHAIHMNRSAVLVMVIVYLYSICAMVHPIVQTATMRTCDSVLQVCTYVYWFGSIELKRSKSRGTQNQIKKFCC